MSWASDGSDSEPPQHVVEWERYMDIEAARERIVTRPHRS
jgi:hypothetical protein